ncbi:MAG: hypothetical protein AABX79_02245 [Nanoarchaeota archaeon]
MDQETKHGVIERKKEIPIIRLLVVPHRSNDLTVSYPAFGTNDFRTNIEEMQKSYSHPVTGKGISFREPTTSESISAAAYDFGNLAKPQIFDPRWLQLGFIVRTAEGVFANPPKNSERNPVTDEKTLKSMLNNAKKENGIWLLPNDFGFAPYETFQQGVQDCDSFTESGLARLLEHTEEKAAGSLREIASPKFYKRGINVFGFDSVKEPVLRVAGLASGRGLGDDGLDVVGYDFVDGGGGLAFGVLE